MSSPSARSFEKSTSSADEEFNRRRRICGQGALGLWKLRACLTGLRAWQFASRKLLRWLCLIPLLGMLVASIALVSQPFFGLLLGAQLICYAFAGIGFIQLRGRRSASKIFSLPLFFVLANLAAICGLLESCGGRRYATWEIPTLSRGRSESARSPLPDRNTQTIVLGIADEGGVTPTEARHDGR